MATAHYKFVDIPKTFTTKAAAIRFLTNSPGYVQRRAEYLHTYWPGLMQELEKKNGASNKPARTRGQLAATALASLKTSGPGLGDVASAVGKTLLNERVGQHAARATPGLIKGTPGAVKANVNWMADLARSEPKTQESTLDFTIGKGLTNLAQGQGPKNWQDVAGLGVGVAGVFPFGRGVKAAGEAIKSAKAAEEAAQAAKVAKVAASGATPYYRGVSTEQLRIARETGKLPAGSFVTKNKKLAATYGDHIIEIPAENVDALPAMKATGEGGVEAYRRVDAEIPLRTINERVQDALKTAPEAIAEQDKLYSQERAIRINNGLKAYYDAGGGTAGADALFGELKGELPKISWGAFTEFTPETADKMIRHIVEESDLRPYEVPRAIAGMRRMIAGRPPQENQRLLLERVFGKGNIDSITNPENAGMLGFIYKHALEAWNTPRTLMASFDMSAPFRQGLVAGARHPVIFAKNIKPMVKAWGSEEYAREVMDEIASSPNLTRYHKSKLALTDAAGPTALHEEQFPPGLLDKAPGVKHSARAYSAFLNRQRTHVFDRMIDVAEQDSRVTRLLGPTLSHYLGFEVKNVDDPEFLDALGRYINVATGRGKLPWKTAEKAAPFLNNFLFSPRLMASRIAILNPVYYVNLYRQSPFVARQAAQALVNTVAGVSTMLYLASNIPGVKVGTNPLSADFGKIRIRDTRIDIAGGLQQYLVLYTRLIQGKSVSSTTGKTQDLKGGYGDSSRKDVLQRFIEGKFAPSAGMIRDALDKQTFTGEPLTPQRMAYKNLVPLNVQGGIELYNTEGSVPAAIGGGLLSSIGFGVNSYPDKPAVSTGSSTGSGLRSYKPGSSRVSNKPSRQRSNKP